MIYDFFVEYTMTSRTVFKEFNLLSFHVNLSYCFEYSKVVIFIFKCSEQAIKLVSNWHKYFVECLNSNTTHNLI